MTKVSFFVSTLTVLLTFASPTKADTVSFLIDPDTIDANMDNLITGNEFSPVGSGGTVFTMEPTNNLVGADRFLLSNTSGIHFGGGGGSSLSFDFTPSNDIQLESYAISTTGFILGNPQFQILQGATVLSTGNDANTVGSHAFASGPIAMDAGTTYSFETTVSGAGIQSFLSSFDYTVTAVPEPSSIGALAVGGVSLFAIYRRRRRSASNGTATI